MSYRTAIFLALILPYFGSSAESSSVAIQSQQRSDMYAVKPLSASQSSAPKAESLVEILFDPTDFRSDPHDGKGFWSYKSTKFYGKSVFDWTDEDFSVYERKLREQLVILKREAGSFVDRVGSTPFRDTGRTLHVVVRGDTE